MLRAGLDWDTLYDTVNHVIGELPVKLGLQDNVADRADLVTTFIVSLSGLSA